MLWEGIYEGKETLKILFCGIAVPEEVECQVKDISAAGNRFQNNVIKNLEMLGHEVTVVSYVAVKRCRRMAEKLIETADCVICYNIFMIKILLEVYT